MPLDGTSSLHTRAGAFDATRRQPITKPTGLKAGWNPNKWNPTKRQAMKALKNQKWHRTTDAAVTEVARELLCRAIMEALTTKQSGHHGLLGFEIKRPSLTNAEPPDMETSNGGFGPAGRVAHQG